MTSTRFSCGETTLTAQPLGDMIAVKVLVVQARETEAQEVASSGGDGQS